MIFSLMFERVLNVEDKVQISIAKYTKAGQKAVSEAADEYMKDGEGDLIQEDHPERPYLMKSPDNYFVMKGKVKVWFKWQDGDAFQASNVADYNSFQNILFPGFETMISEQITSDTVSGTLEVNPTVGHNFRESITQWRPKVSETGLEVLEDNTCLVCPMQHERGWSFSNAILMNGESLEILKEGTDCYIITGEELTLDETKKIEPLKIKKLTSTKITVVNNSGTFCKIAKMFK